MRGLMNSWAAISGLDWPSLASRAICASCGVSSSHGLDVPLADPFAGRGELALRASGERVRAHPR